MLSKFFKRVSLIWELCIIFLGLPMVYPANTFAKDFMVVNCIDVGKGDCFLVNCAGTNILIDTGTYHTHAKVINYLHSQGVRQIDLFVATHPHCDHIGGAEKVIERFPVSRCFVAKMPGRLSRGLSKIDADALERMNSALQNRRVVPYSPMNGERFYIGQMCVEVVGPLRPYDDVNDLSLIVKISYGQKSFVFLGDAERQSISDILRRTPTALRADVVKTSHHGSLTANTPEFLRAIDPRYAIISAGHSGHSFYQSENLKRILKAQGVMPLCTYDRGNIVFTTNGRDIYVT